MERNSGPHSVLDAIKMGMWDYEPEENEEVVQSFLENNRAFRPVSLTLDGLQTSGGVVRTWPHREGADGFFISVLERESLTSF